jgi:hypothetical protein
MCVPRNGQCKHVGAAKGRGLPHLLGAVRLSYHRAERRRDGCQEGADDVLIQLEVDIVALRGVVDHGDVFEQPLLQPSVGLGESERHCADGSV